MRYLALTGGAALERTADFVYTWQQFLICHR
jgi:hypothetical protein